MEFLHTDLDTLLEEAEAQSGRLFKQLQYASTATTDPRAIAIEAEQLGKIVEMASTLIREN